MNNPQLNSNGYGQGYGQQMSPEQYAQALNAFDALQKRKDYKDKVDSSGDPFAMLGAALGDIAAKKIGKFKGQNLSTVEQQIKSFQEFKKREYEEAQMVKKQEHETKRWESRYNQKRQDELSDRDAGFNNQKALLNYSASLRNESKPSFRQQQWNQLSPEQQVVGRQNMFGLNQQQPAFSPEIQAAVQTGAITPQQAQVAQKQKVFGSNEPSLGAEARIKMGLLENAEQSLADYKQNAFKDGDYQEFGSKFGATNGHLDNAVDNLLRFESGASISDDERAQAMDKYSPSMFRSDETNISRIKMMEDKIAQLRSSLGGQQQQPNQGASFQQANNTLLKYTGGQ